jgi:hypothetical protein
MSPFFTCGRFFTFSSAWTLNSFPSGPLSVTMRVFISTASTVAVAWTADSPTTPDTTGVAAAAGAVGGDVSRAEHPERPNTLMTLTALATPPNHFIAPPSGWVGTRPPPPPYMG